MWRGISVGSDGGDENRKERKWKKKAHNERGLFYLLFVSSDVLKGSL